MPKRRILITGLSGAVGRAIRPALDVRYEVAALSRVGVEGVADDLNFRGTVADLASIRPAFEDVDSVVHLAADGGVNSPTGMNAGWESILENNIVGTYPSHGGTSHERRCGALAIAGRRGDAT